MASQESPSGTPSAAADSDTPGLSILLYVLGTLGLAVAVIGGCIIGSSTTTIAGWTVFGGWGFGALALFAVGKALHYLSRTADAAEFAAYGRRLTPPPAEFATDGDAPRGTAEGWLSRPQ